MLLEKITKPSGVSDEEALRRVAAIIERAVSNGLTEVQVYRFPNALCTDRGRAINQQESGWETTLTGLPKEMYRVLGEAASPARIQDPSSDRGLSGRHAWRCRHHAEMGVSQRHPHSDGALDSEHRSQISSGWICFQGGSLTRPD